MRSVVHFVSRQVNNYYDKVNFIKYLILKIIVILLVLIVGLAGCNKIGEEILSAEIPVSVTSFQQFMLDEINLARTNPAGYAELRLIADKDNSSDNGSYLYLKSLSPVGKLAFNNSLNLSASNYAVFLAEKNLMGHNEDGTPLKRAMIVGFEGSCIGENIAACSNDNFNPILNARTAAISFVRVMIIDDGVADFGHRLIILNAKFKSLGIGFTRNTGSTFINYNVQDFGNL